MEIHSPVVFVQLINVQQAIHALIIKFVLVVVVNIVVKMLCAVLVPHANHPLENVFVNQTLLEIQTTCVCHVSDSFLNSKIKKIKKIVNRKSKKSKFGKFQKFNFCYFSFFRHTLNSDYNTRMSSRMWSKQSLSLWPRIK